MRTAGAFRRLACGTVALIVVVPLSGSAHRVDEYLQATRIAVSTGSIDLDIDLTAGTEVAPRVWALIDTDRNGRISETEGRTYVEALLRSMTLRLDDKPHPIALVASRFPTREDMAGGSGAIHIQARAAIPALGAGRHRLFFRNAHQLSMSVYLVNALVPVEPGITIAAQRRDPRQTQATITYDVGPRRRPGRS
jgi:hypothetical protein